MTGSVIDAVNDFVDEETLLEERRRQFDRERSNNTTLLTGSALGGKPLLASSIAPMTGGMAL